MYPNKLGLYPVKIKTGECYYDKSYYYTKAVIGIVFKDRPLYIFGFGCDQSKETSENSAKYECIEHYLGSIYAKDYFHENQIAKSYDLDGDVVSDGKLIHQLLAGYRKNGGRPLNATGLAIGANWKQVSKHAFLELLERHLSYVWWFDKKIFYL